MPPKKISIKKETKKNIATKKFSLSDKIIFIFIALTLSIIMAGFVVQTELVTSQCRYYQDATAYYYNLSTNQSVNSNLNVND